MPCSVTDAKIIEKTQLSVNLMRLVLAPETYIPYQAGQYLQILSDSRHEPLSYSIANAPNQTQTYELHMRQSPNAAIKHQQNIRIQLPFGACTLTSITKRPLLFIAGGTGFAPIKALLEQLIIEKNQNPVHLYWSARSSDGLYLNSTVKAWTKKYQWFHYYPRVSAQDESSIIPFLSNQQIEPIHLKDWEIILAGPFNMVYSIRDELIRYDIPRNQLHSDAFDFE